MGSWPASIITSSLCCTAAPVDRARPPSVVSQFEIRAGPKAGLRTPYGGDHALHPSLMHTPRGHGGLHHTSAVRFRHSRRHGSNPPPFLSRTLPTFARHTNRDHPTSYLARPPP